MGPTQGMAGAVPSRPLASSTPPSPTGADAPATGAAAVPPMAVAQMEEEIARLTRRGYVIVSRTETSAQLKRPKHFSIWWALFWFLIGGLGLPLYVAWYLLIKRDRIAFIRIAPDGRVLCSDG